MPSFKEQYIIEIKTHFLKISVDKSSRIMPELLEKNAHLLSIQFEILEQSFKTDIFQKFCDIQENEIEQFFRSALNLKNDNSLGLSEDFKEVLEEMLIDENATWEEKINFYNKKESLNDFIRNNSKEKGCPKFILNQLSKEQEASLANEPKNITELFNQIDLLYSEEDMILKTGCLEYMEFLSKEMNRLNTEFKMLFFKFFENGIPLSKETHGNLVARKVWSSSEKSQIEFINPENTYCPKTFKFFEYSRMSFLFDEKLKEKILRNKGSVINKIAEKLNIEAHMALFCYMENIPLLSGYVDIKPVVKKLAKTKKQIGVKNITNKFSNNLGFHETVRKIIEEKDELLLQEKIEKLMSDFDNIDFKTKKSSTRAINLNISFFKEFVKFPTKLEEVQFNISNTQFIRSFNNSRLLALSEEFEKLTDNQIIRELFVLLTDLINNPKSSKEINKYDIIMERNVSSDTKEMILNFEKNLRALNLNASLNVSKETHGKKKI